MSARPNEWSGRAAIRRRWLVCLEETFEQDAREDAIPRLFQVNSDVYLEKRLHRTFLLAIANPSDCIEHRWVRTLKFGMNKIQSGAEWHVRDRSVSIPPWNIFSREIRLFAGLPNRSLPQNSFEHHDLFPKTMARLTVLMINSFGCCGFSAGFTHDICMNCQKSLKGFHSDEGAKTRIVKFSISWSQGHSKRLLALEWHQALFAKSLDRPENRLSNEWAGRDIWSKSMAM
jgi:hypothetical protein